MPNCQALVQNSHNNSRFCFFLNNVSDSKLIFFLFFLFFFKLRIFWLTRIHHVSAQPLCPQCLPQTRVAARSQAPGCDAMVVQALSREPRAGKEMREGMLKIQGREGLGERGRAVGSHVSVTGWPSPQDIFILNCLPSGSVQEPLSHSSSPCSLLVPRQPQSGRKSTASPFRKIQNLSMLVST